MMKVFKRHAAVVKQLLYPDIRISQIFAFGLRMWVEVVVLVGLIVHFRDIAVTVVIGIGIAFKHDITSADSISGKTKIMRDNRADKSNVPDFLIKGLNGDE